MKISRNSLKELIRQSINELREDKGDMDNDGKNEPDSEEYMDNKDKAIKKAMKSEGGPGSGKPKGDDESFDSGGPSYANVPKGAKTSKQAKEMSKKKKEKKEESVKEYYLKEDGKTCWKGYEQIGMKDKGGKQVPNCVPIKESNGRRTTVKEVRMWMKKLEENRYKKTYNSDCRRVSWLVNNNLAEDYEQMPASMRKKWSKAAYGRERQLAKEFIKSKQQQMTEGKIRQTIRETIKDLMEGKIVRWEIPMKDKKKVEMIVKKLKLKDTKDYSIYGSGNTFEMELDSKYEDKVLELLMKMNIKVRG